MQVSLLAVRLIVLSALYLPCNSLYALFIPTRLLLLLILLTRKVHDVHRRPRSSSVTPLLFTTPSIPSISFVTCLSISPLISHRLGSCFHMHVLLHTYDNRDAPHDRIYYQTSSFATLSTTSSHLTPALCTPIPNSTSGYSSIHTSIINALIDTHAHAHSF